MTPSTECRQLRISLGVYVLGAIEPAERAMVDAHLSVCDRCRDELASLAGLPAMLARVTEEQIEQLSPPSDNRMLDSMLAKAAGESRLRRRRNRILMAAAAAALVVATGVGVSVAGGGGGGHPETQPKPARTGEPPYTVPAQTVNASDPRTGVRAQIGMEPKEWGTAFTVQLSGAPAGVSCRLIAKDKNGNTDIAGAWNVRYGGPAHFFGSSMISRSQLAEVDVFTMQGKRLLHVPV